VKMFDVGKTRVIGLRRFHLILERNGPTDRRTDRFAILILRISMLTCDKNRVILKSDGSVKTIQLAIRVPHHRVYDGTNVQ